MAKAKNQAQAKEEKTEELNERRIRLSLDLTLKQYARLRSLEDETGTTKAEIVRNSLRLYSFIAEKAFAGYSFRMIDKAGQAQDLVFVELA